MSSALLDVLALIEKLQAPIVHAFSGKGRIACIVGPGGHRYEIGGATSMS